MGSAEDNRKLENDIERENKELRGFRCRAWREVNDGKFANYWVGGELNEGVHWNGNYGTMEQDRLVGHEEMGKKKHKTLKKRR